MYERDSFVPLVQATRSRALRLTPTTDVKALMAGNDGKYYSALDPLWNRESEQAAEPFGKDEIAFYQCDHLGTPQELTDCEGKVAWSAQYRAWGQAKQAIGEAAYKAGMRNRIRFQGQYLDEETGLHYNRHRYYDPYAGRFASKDPIGLLGGVNLHQYAPNPLQWTDPLGLASDGGAGRKPVSSKPNQNSKCECRKPWEVNRFDRVCQGKLNGKSVAYYRDPKSKFWWSKDTEGHGSGAWKVMEESRGGLVHYRDADVYGDFMNGKHKGDTGKFMSFNSLKCKDEKGG